MQGLRVSSVSCQTWQDVSACRKMKILLASVVTYFSEDASFTSEIQWCLYLR